MSYENLFTNLLDNWIYEGSSAGFPLNIFFKDLSKEDLELLKKNILEINNSNNILEINNSKIILEINNTLQSSNNKGNLKCEYEEIKTAIIFALIVVIDEDSDDDD